MLITPISAILKKEWISSRGKKYPAGTAFKRKPNSKILTRSDSPGHWYDFKIPNDIPLPHARGSFGFLYVADKVFMKSTKEDVATQKLRKKNREEHIRASSQLFNM